MIDKCYTCEKNYETCDAYDGEYTMENGYITGCQKYRMSEKEAKTVILNDPYGNIAERMEAIAKLKAYEEKQKADDEIKVGDEVKWNSDLIVVTRLYEDGGFDWCDGISKDGIAFHVLEENVSKTNRHFDIAKILEEMKA